MTEDAFRRALFAFTHRRPFQRFVLEMTSGTRFLVEHPEAVIFHGDVIMHISRTNKVTLLDATSVGALFEEAPAG